MKNVSGNDPEPIEDLSTLQRKIRELEQSVAESRRTAEALRESEAKYRLAFESTSDGIFTLDHDFYILSITPSVERQLGYKVEEVINRPIQDINILTSESLARAVSDVIRVLSGVEVTGAVYEFIAKDGTRKIGEVTGTPTIKDGKIIGVTAIVRDITERKRAEEELRRNQDAAQRLAEETAIIAEIGRVIGSNLYIDEVYQRFSVEARKLIPFDRLSVNLHSRHEGNVKVAYVFGEEISGRRKGDLFPFKGSVSEVLTKTRAGLYSHPKSIGEMDQRFPNHVATIQAGMHSLMSVPLIYRDEVIGSLHFRSRTPDAYTDRHLHLADRIGAQIAGAIANAQLYADLKKAEQELKESEQRYRELSIIDDLTQLYNSRRFYFQLKIELDRSNRYGQPLTLMLLDIDNFKDFNDTYGHVEGDQVLRRLGLVVKRCVRETDFAYRYGGEEFTILLPVTTSADGIVTAERIRAEFKKETFSPAPDQDIHVTVSIGLAQYKVKEDMKAFVHRVDQLMYHGKKDGKDRVCSESAV